MGRTRSRALNKPNKILVVALVLVGLVILLGAIIPYKTRALGAQATCLEQNTTRIQRYQRFFGGNNNAKAYENATFTAHPNPALLCIRRDAGFRETEKAALYLW